MAELKKFEELNFSPSSNPKEWVVVKSVTYVPDKQAVLVKRFTEKFKLTSVTTAEEIYELSSRSLAVANWLREFNVDYVADELVPEQYRAYIPTKTFNKEMENVKKIDAANKKRQSDLLTIQKNAAKAIADADKACADAVTAVYKDSKIAYILTLPKNKLPLSIALKIQNYTPIDATNVLEAKQYANEILFLYKAQLLTMVKDDPDINIVSYVDDLSPK